MIKNNPISSIIAHLGQHASVESVYGDPIEFEDRLIVPVTKIGYGFGGGYGSSGEDDNGSGGGGGGGMSITPIGVIEVTDGGTRFVRFTPRKRLFLAFIAGGIAGLVLGHRERSQR